MNGRALMMGWAIAGCLVGWSVELAVERRTMGPLSAVMRQAIQEGRTGTSQLSPDGSRLVAVRSEGSRFVVENEGTRSQLWDQVGLFHERPGAPGYTFQFSPDGQRVAYVAREGATIYLVEGKEKVPIEPANVAQAGSIIYSADSSRYAMVATQARNATEWVVTDGKKRGPYGKVQNLRFSGDGRHLAFVGVKNAYDPKQGSALVVDEEQWGGVQAIEQVQISFDGRHTAFAARGPGDGWKVYRNGKAVPGLFAKVEQLSLSRDGQHLAFVGSPMRDGFNATGEVAYVDGKVSREYLSIQSLKLSPDGLRHAYVAQVRPAPQATARYVAVVDGKESRDYGTVYNDATFFSGDSRHVAVLMDRTFVLFDGQEYVSQSQEGPQVVVDPGSGSMVFKEFGENNLTRVYLNGRKGPELGEADLGSMVFSKDGTHIAYPGRDRTNRAAVILDEQVYVALATPFVRRGAQMARVVPSPDGTKVLYYSEGRVHLNGQAGFRCPGATPPRFSPDSAHFASACMERDPRTRQAKFTVVVDGMAGPVVDLLFGTEPGDWRFPAEGAVTFPAVVGDEIVSLRVRPPAGGIAANFTSGAEQSPVARRPGTAREGSAGASGERLQPLRRPAATHEWSK